MHKVGNWYVPHLGDRAAEDHFSDGGACQIGHLHAALRYVTDWGLALDCGAHVGSWAAELSRKFGWVHAFEPLVPLGLCLMANLAERRNVTLWTACVGDRFGSLRMDFMPKASMSSHVAKGENGRGWAPVMPIDALGLAPGFVKIDVEGYEVKALRGMRETLERCKPVVCIEWKGKHMRRYGDDPEEAERILRDSGLTLKLQVEHDRIYAR